MAGTPEGQIACPYCGKLYKWKPTLAGRNVTCQCGQKMLTPRTAEGQALAIGPAPDPADALNDDGLGEEGTYELDLPEERARKKRPVSPLDPSESDSVARDVDDERCPSCNQPMKPGAIVCIKCGFNIREGKKIKIKVGAADAKAQAKATSDEADAAEKPKVFAALVGATSGVAKALESRSDEQKMLAREVYLPLVLAGGAILTILIEAFLLTGDWGPTYFGTSRLEVALGVLTEYAVLFAIQMPLVLIGLLLVAKIFGTSYGTFGVAILKLAAVGLLTLTSGHLLNSLIMMLTGGVGIPCVHIPVIIAVMFGVFFAAASALLDMEPMEAFVLFLTQIFLPFAALLFLVPLIMSAF